MCCCRSLTGKTLNLLLAFSMAAALLSSGCGRKTAEPSVPAQRDAAAITASGSGVLASGAVVLMPGGGKNGIASGTGSFAIMDSAPRKSAMTPAMRREFERRYEKGIELLEKEEYGEASRIFEQLLTESSDPQDASGRILPRGNLF